LAQGIGREQLSETPKKAARGPQRKRGTAEDMGVAGKGLRTRRDMVNKPGSLVRAQLRCKEPGKAAPGAEAALLLCPARGLRSWQGWRHPSPDPISWGWRSCHVPC